MVDDFLTDATSDDGDAAVGRPKMSNDRSPFAALIGVLGGTTAGALAAEVPAILHTDATGEPAQGRHHRRADRDGYEVPVHHIDVHPVGGRRHLPHRLGQATEVGQEDRRSDPHLTVAELRERHRPDTTQSARPRDQSAGPRGVAGVGRR
jgi:hypothetical protein